MRRFKFFLTLLVFILLILPVRGFEEKKEYTPEEIIKLLHDLGYEYCKEEPSKDISDDIVWNAVMWKSNFNQKYIFPGFGADLYERKPKTKEEEIAQKLEESNLAFIDTDHGFDPVLLVFKNFKILETETLNLNDLEVKKVKVLYDQIGIFNPREFGEKVKGYKAGFSFERKPTIITYYFVKTPESWKLFLPSKTEEFKEFKSPYYLLPVPPCAVIKQYKTVYLKVTPENFQKYVCEGIIAPTTSEIKKEIQTVIRKLERIK
ncbi:MAG: hypothetical protein JHC31_06490 [Sulfurihydrogenibium sp.]|nr:hypothetical protein [Sulfurihydrogenibium sp.]